MPNELIDFYRQQYPDDTISDQRILGGFVRQHGEAAIKSQYPDAFGRYVKKRRKDSVALYNRLNPPGIIGEGVKALKRTTIGLGETFAGAFGLGSAAIGWEGGRDYFLQTAMGWGESASDISLAAAEGEWKDVDGLYEGLLYSSSVFGEAFPSLAESLVLAAGGALAGSATAPGPGTVVGGVGGFFAKNAVKGLLKKKVKEAVRKNLIKELGVKSLTDKRMRAVLMRTALSGKGAGLSMVKAQMKASGAKLGGTLATTLNSYGMSSGEIYNSLASNPNVDPDDAINIALVGGLVAAVPDTFLPGYIISKSGVIDALAGTVKSQIAKTHVKRRFNGYVTRLAKQAALTIPTEGSTEGFQELVNIAAEKYGDKTSEHFKETGSWFAPMQYYSDLTDDEKGRIDRAIVVGAAAGSMGATVSAVRPSVDSDADETEIKPTTPAAEVVEEIYSPTEEQQAKIISLIQRELAGDATAAGEVAAAGLLSNRILQKFYRVEKEKALKEQGFKIQPSPEEDGEVDEDYIQHLKDQIARVKAAELSPKIKSYLKAELVKKLRAAQKGEKPTDTVSMSMTGEEREVKTLLDEQLGLLEAQPEEDEIAGDDDALLIEADRLQSEIDRIDEELSSYRKKDGKLTVDAAVARKLLAKRGELQERLDQVAEQGDIGSFAENETSGQILLPESTGAEEVRNRERDAKWQQEDNTRDAERLQAQKTEDEKKLAVLNERLRKAREASVKKEGGRRTAETALSAVWKAKQDADRATEQAAKNLQARQDLKEARERKAAERLMKKVDAQEQADTNEKEAKEEEKKQGDPVNASHVADEPKSSLGDNRLSTPGGVKVKSFLNITSDIWDRLKDRLDVLGNILTQKAGKKKGGKGLSKRDSRRITALLDSNTGEVYAVKTWKEGGEVWVAAPDGGKLKLKTALDQGYVPIASILTTVDSNVKDYTPFANRNDFDAAFAETIANAKAEDAPPAETETRQRPVQPETSQEEAKNLNSLKQAKALFDRIIRAAVARGLNFEIFEDEKAKMEGEYGAYANAYQLIRIALADAASPTSETIRMLLHEVGHAVFANEPVEVREAIHRAINSMSDKTLQLEGFSLAVPEGMNEAEVVQEERLVETTSIALQQEGFDPTVAQSISQKFLRFLKDLYYRAAMALQRSTGLNIANDELPLRYFQNRMRMFLAGDKDVFSYLSFLGGPKLNITETIGISRKIHDTSIDMDISFRDMTIGHSEVIPDNKLAARLGVRLRASSRRRVTDPEPIVQEGEEYNSVQMKKGEVYMLKLVDDMYRKLYETWRTTGGEASGLTYEQWLASDFMSQEDPAVLIAEINSALEGNGQEQINPDEVTSSSLDQRKQLPLAKEAAYRKISLVRATLLKNYNKSQENLDPTKKKSLSWKINQAKEKLVALVQKYTDADMARNALYTNLIEAVKVLRDDIRQIGNASRKKGELYQVIRQLEGKTPDAKAAEQVERKLLKLVRDSRDGKSNFFDMIEAAARLLQDRSDSESRWQSLTATQIAEIIEASGDPLLEPLVKDRQLLAGVIAIAKKDSLIMDLLSLRRDSERGKVDELLREVLVKGRADEATIRHATQRLPRLEKIANRLMLTLNKKQSEFIADERRLQAEVDKALFWDSVAQVLDDQMAMLEDDLGIETADRNVQAFALYDGAKIPVPASEDTTIEDLKDPTKLKEVSLKAGQVNQDTLRIYYAKIKKWLIANEDKPHSATYRQMERIANELAVAAADLIEKGMRRKVATKWLDSFPRALFLLDSGIATIMGRRIERFQGEWERMEREADLHGSKWTIAEKDLMDLLSQKIDDREAFRLNWYQSALQFFEKRPDLLAFSKDNKKMREHAYNKHLENLAVSPEFRKLIEQRKVKEAFYKYMDATGVSSGWFDSQRKRLRIKLSTDKKAGYLRESIGEPIFTVMRRLSDHASVIYELMRESGWLEVKSDEPFDDSRPLFSNTVWRDFVKPIISREGRTLLASVQRADGIERLARRSNILEAYEAVKPGENGFYSIREFAEILYSLEEGDPADMESRQQFIEQTFLTFNDVFLALHSQKQELAGANNDGNMGVPLRILMDTRKAEELPAEFLEHVTFDSRTMRQMAKIMAMEAQYGRNNSTMMTGFSQLIQEISNNAKTFAMIANEIYLKNPTANRRERTKAVKAEMKSRGLNYEVYSRASANLGEAQNLQMQWTAYQSSEGHVSTENRMAQEIVGTAAGATVQGFGTLVLDLSAPIIQGQTKMSGGGGTRFAGSIYKKAFGEVLGSFWQMFGKTFGLKADNARRRARNGYIFADAHMRMQDQFRSALNEVNQNDRLLVETGDTTGQMVGKRIKRGLLNFTRTVRTLIGSGFGKSKLELNDAAFSTVKPQAPYTWGTEVIHAAAVDTYVEKFESLLGRAVEFLQKPENRAELQDPTFAFNTKDHAKELGFGRHMVIFDTTQDLDYFLSAMSDKGLSLEQLAREYIERSATDPEATLVTDNNFHHIASLANRDIMLANNVTTQPRFLLSGKVAPVMQNLIGWSIRRTGDLFRMFRKPDGSGAENMNQFRKALQRLTFVIAPSALAWAVVRDWWDEDIYGKTPNVLKFRNVRTPTDAAMTLLDRTARVGVGGIAGDMANGWLNVQTGRGWSVDSRIYVLNSIYGLSKALATFGYQKGASYETVYRPMAQALGGSGFLQNFVTYKNFLETISGADLETQEDRIVARINIGNIIRAAGRMSKNLDVRGFGGFKAIGNPIKMHVKDMITAAYANDAGDFQNAYRQAVVAAASVGKADPHDSVARSFGAYNPLRTTFKTDPTEAEYVELLRGMGQNAARTVREGLTLYNSYAQQIGSKPFFGKVEKAKKTQASSLSGSLPTLNDYRLTATLPSLFR